MDKEPSTTNSETPQPQPPAAQESTAAPIVAPGDTVTTGVAADEPVTVVMKPPKKHRGGLIAVIIILILLILSGGALAVWYFAVYNNPENVALDAIHQLLSAENVVTDGKIEIFSQDSKTSRTVAVLEFDSSSMRVPNSSNVKLSLSERDANDRVIDNHLVEIELGTAIMADGDIYFRVSNAMETLDRLMDSSDSDLSFYGELGPMLYDIIELIDNEWWQISPDDIVDALEVDASDARPALKFYDCVLDLAQSDYYSEIATIYDENRFLEIAKTDRAASAAGRSVYGILSLDHESLANFINALPESNAANEFYSCYNQFTSDVNDGRSYDNLTASDFDEISKYDIKEALPDEWAVYFEISNFGHKLYKITGEAAQDDTEVTVDLSFDYSLATVSAPQNYRPITDLIDEISELWYGALY